MIYSLSEVKKIFNHTTVLNIETLDIKRGFIYALLGPNGAGKTTLLNILSFIEPPTSGEITYNKQRVNFYEPELHRLRRSVVMLDQHPILFSTTVFKNIEFGLKVRKVPLKERREIVLKMLELVGMELFMHKPAAKLSGGETQRVALARVLALSPEVLLCDEPTSSVDLENKTIITNILKRINREQKITIIFTSHDRDNASLLAHKTIYLERGSRVSSERENVFTAQLTPQKDGLVNCTVNNNMLFSTFSKRSGKRRLYLDPYKIRINLNYNKQVRDGEYTGKITLISSEKNKIRVMVDIGLQIAVVIGHEEYMAQTLMVGQKIQLIIGPDAVMVVDKKRLMESSTLR